ncbi:DUF1190 domain-containing protein [Pseudomonas sp. NFIX28]|jgi:uncharacterized protein YgiB involved in biofilm formation|uniref:DUF1190 domain-containing protein n=1 Tax=Pseudomonas sp. NFIX28 TaxID=1566235 RepID=UPI000895FFAC|nr:DUF1190 domain-containing protein [Pseudomonas sp. NFIX28]SDZ63042.1 Uncharacterized conserved protein YgiB, involved in bioifilm formation, UPF0441/DUF1190 family [Pseudomonas sp. NFIX28]
MKRSQYVQLSLAASVALAVSGCNSEPETLAVQQKFNFQSVQECVDGKIAVDVCSDAYIKAMAEHRAQAPVYDNQADCDADFVENWCQMDSSGKFVPKLGGFEINAQGAFTREQLAAAGVSPQAGQGSSFSSIDSGLLTGLLIGNMLSGGSRNYYSEPVYRYRDNRGGYANSTLNQRIASGSTFSKSRQAQYGKGFQTTRPMSVASSTSRGGFGSQASARSGWGGSSSSSWSSGRSSS